MIFCLLVVFLLFFCRSLCWSSRLVMCLLSLVGLLCFLR